MLLVKTQLSKLKFGRVILVGTERVICVSYLSVCPHVLSSKLLVGFRLNLEFGCTDLHKGLRANLVLVHVGQT